MSNSAIESPLLLGIDGGGTHTRVLLAGDDGRVLGVGWSSGSNYQSVGVAAATRAIDDAVGAAWRSAARTRQSATHAMLGMAGVVSIHDREIIQKIASDLGLADQVHVDHDIRIALAGGLAGKQGIALVAGTGSACYGRRDNDSDCRAGGWGHLVDDVGSGYRLGLDALTALARMYDGRGCSTTLAEPLELLLGLSDRNDLLRRLGNDRPSKSEIAAMAPLVLEQWQLGDRVSTEIVQRNIAGLVEMVRTVGNRLFAQYQSLDTVAVGGLLQNPEYRAALVTVLAQDYPAAKILSPILPPEAGALLLAVGMSLGAKPGSDVIERIASTIRTQKNIQHH